MMKELEKAIFIATNAHAGQFDKGGMPYILHPLAVMEMMRKDGYSEHYLSAAVLHDVCEDTHITPYDLAEGGIDKDVIDAVIYLTKTREESYESYLANLKQNSIARRVKMYDIRHNSDFTRLKGFSEKDIARLAKYAKAFDYLSHSRDISG